MLWLQSLQPTKHNIYWASKPPSHALVSTVCVTPRLSQQVHVLLSAGYLTIWQVLHPAFMQLLQTTAPTLACQALQELHGRGRRLRQATQELERMLADLQEGAGAGAPDGGELSSDEGRTFEVWLCWEVLMGRTGGSTSAGQRWSACC
jgi:hypothetical protein